MLRFSYSNSWECFKSVSRVTRRFHVSSWHQKYQARVIWHCAASVPNERVDDHTVHPLLTHHLHFDGLARMEMLTCYPWWVRLQMYPCHYGPERPAGIHNSTPPPTCGYVLNVRDQVRLLTDHQTKPPSRSNVDQFNLGIVGLLTQVDTSTTPRTTWSALCATPRISEHHSNSITVKRWNVTKAFIMDVHRERARVVREVWSSHIT